MPGTSSLLNSRQQHLQQPFLNRCPSRNTSSGWVGAVKVEEWGAGGGSKAWVQLGHKDGHRHRSALSDCFVWTGEMITLTVKCLTAVITALLHMPFILLLSLTLAILISAGPQIVMWLNEVKTLKWKTIVLIFPLYVLRITPLICWCSFTIYFWQIYLLAKYTSLKLVMYAIHELVTWTKASHFHPHHQSVSTLELNTCKESSPPLHPLLHNSHQQTGSRIQAGLRKVLW